MVILKFNKLIRNKWLWGAFAVTVSASFCLDGLFTSQAQSRRDDAEVGSLAGEPVSAEEFDACVAEARGFGRNRDDRPTMAALNRKAWETLAATRTAEANGVCVSDRQLAQAIRGMFSVQGVFDFNRYRQTLANELGLTPEMFERHLRRQMAVEDGLLRTLVGCETWVPPMALEQKTADLIDTFSVRVVRFQQSDAAAKAVKLDDAALKSWYDRNLSKIELPDLVRIRFARFDTTNAALLAKMTISTNDVLDYYDANIDRFTVTDTNGVETVKPVDAVRDELEGELRKLAALEYWETNLTRRAYRNALPGEDKKVSRLTTIAAEEGVKVRESAWFSLDGRSVEGFSVPASTVCPGAENFAALVSELDMEDEDFRYQVVRSSSSVWLIEKIGEQKARTPTFEEAKSKIYGRAMRDARDEALKSAVEALAAKGIDAVVADEKNDAWSSKLVSTNLTFAACDLSYNAFPDQGLVVSSAMALKKGGVSPFALTGSGRGLVVVCDSRTEGDAARAAMFRSQLRDQLAAPAFRDLSGKWVAWNLKRLGFVTGANTSVAEEPVDDESVLAD